MTSCICVTFTAFGRRFYPEWLTFCLIYITNPVFPDPVGRPCPLLLHFWDLYENCLNIGDINSVFQPRSHGIIQTYTKPKGFCQPLNTASMLYSSRAIEIWEFLFYDRAFLAKTGIMFGDSHDVSHDTLSVVLSLWHSVTNQTSVSSTWYKAFRASSYYDIMTL